MPELQVPYASLIPYSIWLDINGLGSPINIQSKTIYDPQSSK